MPADLALGRDAGGPLNLKWGGKQVLAILWGSTTLWVQPVINTGPDIDNGLLSDVAAWLDEVPILGLWEGAGIGLIKDLIMFLIPDGKAATLGLITSIMRSEGTVNTDDSYVEVTVGSIGYKGLITDVLTHYPGNGSGSQGVGFRLIDSTLAIVQRKSSVTTVKQSCGIYRIGDVLRFESHGTGNWHTLYRNGREVGIFSDIGDINLGFGYRTVAMAMQAEVETAGGARSNSPALTNLIAGDLQTSANIPSVRIAIGVDAPHTTGGEDFDVGDVSAQPGGAGMGVGVSRSWTYVRDNWIFFQDQH